MKKLNEEQIAQLYEFTRRHFVEHYDLQTELVDHLANGIEKQWVDDAQLPFEKALQLEFKKFGVFGFTEIVEQRMAAMQKRYFHIIGKHALEFLQSLNMVVWLLCTAILLLVALKITHGTLAIYTIGFVAVIISLAYMLIKAHRHRRLLKHEQRKRWMFEELINKYGMGQSILWFPYYTFINSFIHLDHLEQPSDVASILVVSLTALFFLLSYLIFIDIPKKASVYLAEVYPEYNMV